ncbi:MAG TPA: type II toxin-antitoxin system ParD family antitoxin [Verrucomicrobiales bacterium]|nr:type II toxin-antitoxin system ParD family antitoxin [Verrucomicrobiales bacterium]
MNISLTPELEEFVSKKVKTGRYCSASEVIREGLRLLERSDLRPEFPRFSTQEELETLLLSGISSAENGKLLDGKKVIDGLRKKYATV